MKSDITPKQKFWIFLAICFQLTFIFDVSLRLDADGIVWAWAFIYPLMASGLLQFFVFGFYLLQFFGFAL